MAFHESVYKDEPKGLNFETITYEQAVDLERTGRELIVKGNRLMYELSYMFMVNSRDGAMIKKNVDGAFNIIMVMSDILGTLTKYCIEERDFLILLREIDNLYRECKKLREELPEDYVMAHRTIGEILGKFNRWTF